MSWLRVWRLFSGWRFYDDIAELVILRTLGFEFYQSTCGQADRFNRDWGLIRIKGPVIVGLESSLSSVWGFNTSRKSSL